MKRKLLFSVFWLSLILFFDNVNAEITADTLAVIVNKRDPLSIKIADYYQRIRNIPKENIIEIELDKSKSVINPIKFNKIKVVVDNALDKKVQGIMLTWMKPYRVGCMSITSAFAFGFNRSFCSKNCGKTKLSEYYNSETRFPYRDYNIRPTFSLAALNFKEAKKIIDRGKLSDSSFPAGTGYLVSTTDKGRNVRSVDYERIVNIFPRLPRLKLIYADYIENKTDILFYFTGLKFVPKIETNRFVAGAIADHLTSTGGVLTGGRQMSILRWLEAGATGSYGTVKEPCNYRQKFPNPAIVIKKYSKGETLMEAYWKSVAWPGEGIFIGEPLASPFKLLKQEKNLQ